MRDETDRMHDDAERIGRALGFATKREVSIAPHAKYEGYAPRLDAAWLLPLTDKQRAAMKRAGALPPIIRNSLIVAGWEVEGSDVSTRGTQANLANIRVSGAAYGFVALRGGTVDNLHERARKAARTQRHYFGAQDVLVLDARWLAELAERAWSSKPITTPRGSRKPVSDGGEGGWAAQTRTALRTIGEGAGFDVTESYPSRLAADRKLTTSKIDMVWSRVPSSTAWPSCWRHQACARWCERPAIRTYSGCVNARACSVSISNTLAALTHRWAAPRAKASQRSGSPPIGRCSNRRSSRAECSPQPAMLWAERHGSSSIG